MKFVRLASTPCDGSWSKTEREVLACPLEHGQDRFNTETAPDGLSGRSGPIPADPVDCVHGRTVQRLSVLVPTKVPEPVGYALSSASSYPVSKV